MGSKKVQRELRFVGDGPENEAETVKNPYSVKKKPVLKVEVDAIWAIYPRKHGKAVAIPLIKQAIREVGYQVIFDAVTNYACCRRVQENIVMLPKTYFGPQKRWEDEIDDLDGGQQKESWDGMFDGKTEAGLT